MVPRKVLLGGVFYITWLVVSTLWPMGLLVVTRKKTIHQLLEFLNIPGRIGVFLYLGITVLLLLLFIPFIKWFFQRKACAD